MSKILVGGSIAFDNLMDFPGRFDENILPDQIHNLNVSFLVNSLKRNRGGTASNIAYNLALVGEKPAILGTAGKDFQEYKAWLDENGIDTGYIKVVGDDYTACCFITTDAVGNQITGFYPGAMSRDAELSLKQLDTRDVAMMIIAPTVPEAMVKWVGECRELGVPYLYDPGMQIPRMTGGQLENGIRGAEIAVFNEYEYSMLKERTGMSDKEVLSSVKLLAITLGEKGSLLRRGEEEALIPPARAERVVNPTGAGDAFRAGLLKGYFEGAPLEKMGRYASISAVYAVEYKGATEHSYTGKQFIERYIENFGGI